jgi:sterol-4alpha-carboxylate 3-dehydrogenase (decarboxylating)
MDNHKQANSLGTCVVIGGSGWTGSHLIALLVMYRAECKAVSKTIDFTIHSVDITPPSAGFKSYHKEEDSYTHCDITDLSAVMVIFHIIQPKTIFHTASIVDLRLYPSIMLEKVNVQGTINLLQALKAFESHEVSCFVYTSTFDVVSTKHGISDATESAPYVDNNPSNHYKRTKIIAEKSVLQASCDSVLTCALRPGHIFGPGDNMLYTQASTSPLAIGPITAKMSFTYVDNCATAHLLAALALYKENESNKKDNNKIIRMKRKLVMML